MRYFAVVILILFTCLPAGITLAAGGATNTGTNITLINPLGAGTDLSELVDDILQFVINIGSIVIIFMLVYIGYLFVMAQGAEAKLTKAKEAIKWTIIGALILLGAQAISLGIQATVQALSTGS